MKRPYLRLLQKELGQALPTAAVFTTGIVAWHVFLYTRIDKWPSELITGTSGIPLGFIPLWVLWRSFATLRQEWTGNHMYLLLALPIPGWYITSVKVITVFLEAAWYGAIINGGVLMLAWKSGVFQKLPFESLVPDWTVFFWPVMLALVVVFCGVVITQFSYIAGRLVSRRSGLVSAVTFMLSLWMIIRVGTLLAPVLRWVPEIPLGGQTIIDGTISQQIAYLGIAPLLGSFLAALGLFWLGASLLERDVEL